MSNSKFLSVNTILFTLNIGINGFEPTPDDFDLDVSALIHSSAGSIPAQHVEPNPLEQIVEGQEPRLFHQHG